MPAHHVPDPARHRKSETVAQEAHTFFILVDGEIPFLAYDGDRNVLTVERDATGQTATECSKTVSDQVVERSAAKYCTV